MCHSDFLCYALGCFDVQLEEVVVDCYRYVVVGRHMNYQTCVKVFWVDIKP